MKAFGGYRGDLHHRIWPKYTGPSRHTVGPGSSKYTWRLRVEIPRVQHRIQLGKLLTLREWASGGNLPVEGRAKWKVGNSGSNPGIPSINTSPCARSARAAPHIQDEIRCLFCRKTLS